MMSGECNFLGMGLGLRHSQMRLPGNTLPCSKRLPKTIWASDLCRQQNTFMTLCVYISSFGPNFRAFLQGALAWCPRSMGIFLEVPGSDVRIRTSRIRIRIQTAQIPIQLNPNPSLFFLNPIALNPDLNPPSHRRPHEAAKISNPIPARFSWLRIPDS